jgi:hypothetical protein
MSYIIAFVRFPETEMDYPVECFRADIEPREDVIVRLANSKLKRAAVERVAYLNWDCKGRIECKVSEVGGNGNQKTSSQVNETVGLATMEATVEHLRLFGWIPLRLISKQYRIALTHCNDTQTANIFFRKNGVDLQIITERRASMPKVYSRVSYSLAEGRLVRHFLSQTTFNLYEGISRFATCFLSNDPNLDRFFKSVGSSERATQEVKNRVLRSNPDAELSLRRALAGCEDAMGRIYLSDGVYI